MYHAKLVIDPTLKSGAMKSALRQFGEQLEFNLSITFPVIGNYYPGDEQLIQRFKEIEARLCGQYCGKYYHRLPYKQRFITFLYFEGEALACTRHAHLLMRFPEGLIYTQNEQLCAPGFLEREITTIWNDMSPPHQQMAAPLIRHGDLCLDKRLNKGACFEFSNAE